MRTKVNKHTSIVFLLKTLKFHENLHFFSKISEKGRVWEKIHCYWDFWMPKLDRFDGFLWLRRIILLRFTSNYAPSRLFPLFTSDFCVLGELLQTYFYPVAFFFHMQKNRFFRALRAQSSHFWQIFSNFKKTSLIFKQNPPNVWWGFLIEGGS